MMKIIFQRIMNCVVLILPLVLMPVSTPQAWTLSLLYAGGGLNSLGGIAIDGEGNLWAGDNFLVGSQSTIFASYGG